MRKWLIGIGAAFASLFSTAQAQSPVPAHAAPQAWVRYAGLVEKTFEDRLTGDSDQAKRLRAYFGGSVAVNVITVSVWIDPQGDVSRVVFAPFLDQQANADLTGLLLGAKLAAHPPSDIMLPIHLNLHIAPLANKGTTPGVVPTNDNPKPD
jgi:hypothetical protein